MRRIEYHGLEKIDSFLGKKYKLDHSRSEKFDEYLKALGIGKIMRTVAQSLEPVFDLRKTDDVYTMRSVSTLKVFVVNFTLDQELDLLTPDRRRVKAVFSVDGNKLTEVQKGTVMTILVREFRDTEMIMKMTVGGVTATMYYKAV